MTERKDEILEAALQLFVKQGFHSTSIQHITAACGISKGGFYKHFDSKETMLLELLRKVHENMLYEAENYQGMQHEPELKRLEGKIRIELEKFTEYRPLFQMLFTEFPPHTENKISNYLNRMRRFFQEWHEQSLLEAFGPRVRPYVSDLAVILEGIMHSYLTLMTWHVSALPLNQLSAFIVERLHSIVKDDSDLRPQLPRGWAGGNGPVQGMESIRCEAEALLLFVKARHTQGELSEKTLQTTEMIYEEFKAEIPREFLIDALLHQLQHHADLHTHTQKLSAKWSAWKGETHVL